MAVKEFSVMRKQAVTQFFTVRAESAAEARAIIEAEAEKSKFVAAPWELQDSEVRDRRVTRVAQAEPEGDPVFFIRTTKWIPR